MLFLSLLLQLGLTFADGGTPRSVSLAWPGVTITQTNDDGTTFTRPVLGYYVYRAPIVNGVTGPAVLLNGDAPVMGMPDEDGAYEDRTAGQGLLYAYSVSAADLAGESAPSPVVMPPALPINPNTPPNVQANVQ